MRGESSDVFVTPEGNLEAREYLRPVRARVNGEWRPVETDLSPSADGSVAPKATTVGLAFSGGGETPLVRMTKAGRELALSWPEKLPAPELAGPRATYRNVLPDVDLRMEARVDGFTQLLVVNSAEAAANEKLTELRLKLAAGGMDVRETDDGGLAAVDKGAQGTVFEAPRPTMWDSSSPTESTQTRSAPAHAGLTAAGEGTAGEPAATESGKLAPVGVTLPAHGQELVLTPDADVLRGEDTRYPVFIDPQWYTPKATAWTMASKYWASSPQWKFNGESTAGLGLCDWNYCQPHDTKRLMYRLPTSKFAGKSILSAEFVVRNTWSASCTAKSVELWRTKDISSSTTWNSQNVSGFWIKQLASKSFAHGYTGCTAKDAEFDVKSAVQEAANGKWASMTFGLQAASESDGLGWKRFSDEAFLRVQYNRPPLQLKMSQLSMQYGGVCKSPDRAPRVRTLGTININGVTDPDGDNVAVQVQAVWDAGDGKGLIARWKPPLTSYKKSSSNFPLSLPTSIPQNRTVHWHVRAYDGAQYSPWSSAGDPTACYFVYDKTVPAAPTIFSGEYPESRPEDPNDPWLDGVGQYGTFTFDTASSDVTRYWYGINSDPSSARQLTTSAGAAKSVPFLPSKPGLNFITAQAFDAAGNGSEIRTYQFRVKAGQPARATWQLNEPEEATQAKGSTPARVLGLHGGAQSGAAGMDGSALALDGVDGYAATDLTPIQTAPGHSVAAWVRLDRLPADGSATVLSLPGSSVANKALYYSAAADRWVFNHREEDAAGSAVVRAMAGAPGDAQVGRWTHLVGTYYAGTRAIKLFVDGRLAGEATLAKPWNARQGVLLGAVSNADNGVSGFLPGALDQVQLFDRALEAEDVARLQALQPVGGPGSPAVAIFDLDEEPGASEVSGHGGVLPAIYHGGVVPGVAGVAGKAARFDGRTGYGQISGPHINTFRSFTVSTWAKLERKQDGSSIVVAQAGEHAFGFALYYSRALDQWVINQYTADSPGADIIRATQPAGTTAAVGEWVHLVGVRDSTPGTLTLYVNGVKAGSTPISTAFSATRATAIGAGSYDGVAENLFPGLIDDVRLFDRPVSAEEVQQLFRQRPILKSRWNFEETTPGTPVGTPDSSQENNHLSLYGGAELGMGWVDYSGLQLNGTDAYAATARMPVDTSTSFTMTAWAQAAAMPDHDMAVLSAGGANRSALEVRYRPDPSGLGSWQLTFSDKDSTTATVKQLSSTEFADVRDWNHIAVVYDGFAKEASLYVNGNLQEVACGDADADGNADEAGCQDLIAWADDVLTFKAAKSIQIGRAQGNSPSAFFAGAIDDVWAFQGALNEGQIRELVRAWAVIPTEVPDGN
ncbi:LamG-like jellyroll fold domain-containing protein [Streptomyces sp. ISL-111]|uniref:LamG-like jellyroll fold domain-containing protein n=1 Tax=Streptomyces sp. ISL-111 TaxID=2819175 RepID=UPI002035FA72|nr:LamG-like jellyroll fold domain-containing protein [Streptomyces sp. ISL-111]